MKSRKIAMSAIPSWPWTRRTPRSCTSFTQASKTPLLLKAELRHYYKLPGDRTEGGQERSEVNSRRRTFMRLVKVLIAISISCGFLLTLATAKPEYAKKEGKACTFCHSKMGSKEVMANSLTDAGKYYKAHDHSLEGYKAPEK